MPSLDYKRQFAADVKSGKKRQTIRATRQRPFRIGDTLYHWVDQRQPTRQRLGIHKCRMAVDIEFDETGVYLGEGPAKGLGVDEVLSLAIADGFRSVEDMMAWIEQAYGLPFCGQLIMW